MYSSNRTHTSPDHRCATWPETHHSLSHPAQDVAHKNWQDLQYSKMDMHTQLLDTGYTLSGPFLSLDAANRVHTIAQTDAGM
jgi:hypothetical protein